MTKDILQFFPINEDKGFKGPRSGQTAVLRAVEKAFREGYKNVLLEAPVGSGKSGIAVTASDFYGSAHILTPRKSLQNQYMDDFRDVKEIVMMKGRGAYPCSRKYNSEEYRQLTYRIEEGEDVSVIEGTKCSEAPCLRSSSIRSSCKDARACPYDVAWGVADSTKTVVHNLHSFIFQAYFAGKFDKRNILIIDEAHEIEGIIRGFAVRKIDLPLYVTEETYAATAEFRTLLDWKGWLTGFARHFSDRPSGSSGVSDREAYLSNLDALEMLSDAFGEKFVVSGNRDRFNNKTQIEITPEQIGSLVEKYLLNFSDRRLLMSGTIYSKTAFCKRNGLNENETCFIRIPSTFPKENRPIYCKSEYLVDTSHALWEENYPKMVANIDKVFNIFDDAKGLIHAPSYLAAEQLYKSLEYSGRVVTHNKDNLQETLEAFYASEEPLVLISPVCQQGVDFKYDRARFQIVLRVPYLNTGDAFINYMVKKDFSWYNHQALIIFGQQMGRVNRSEDDYGVTILMDERFPKFLSRNRNVIPKWLTDAIIYK